LQFGRYQYVLLLLIGGIEKMYDIQQRDIDILSQHTKELHIKLELLNGNYQTIDYLEGALISGSSLNDASSDIKRTCEFVFNVKNKSYLAKQSGTIFFNKYVRVYIGIKSLRLNEILWYPLGLYMFDTNSYSYNATENKLTAKCIDLMAKLTGTRNGQIGALTTIIPVDSNIRNAMVSVVNQLGFIKKYSIENISSTVDSAANKVPYDLKFTIGSTTVFDIIKKLRDIYAGYMSYFDDDTFICKRYPTCENDSIVLDWETIEKKQLVISENRNVLFENIKNVTEVWGKVITSDNYSDICTITTNQYNVTNSAITALVTSTVYSIKVNATNIANQTIKFNSLTAYPITDSSGIPLSVNTLVSNQTYSFKFYNSTFVLLGQSQVHAIAMLVSTIPSESQKNIYKSRYNCDDITYIVNNQSPFTVEKVGKDTDDPYKYGAILDVKSGSEFDSIYSQDLCRDRAIFENGKTTRLQDTIELEMQLIPWIDTNQKFTYRSKITGEIGTYITQSISMNFLDGKMAVSASTFYSLYPNIT